jgi:hypothetical protein
MAEAFIFFFIVSIFLTVIAVLVTIHTVTKSKGTDHLRLLGEEIGIDVTGGEPYFPSIQWLSFLKKPTRVNGDYRGGTTEIWHFSRGNGKSSSPYIGLKLRLENRRKLSFQFNKEGFFSKIGKTFGMQDVKVGDVEFDKTFIVKCSDPEFIQAALLPEIMEKFHKAFEQLGAKGTIKLKDNEIYYEEGGRIRSDESRARFAALVDLCADLRETVAVYNEDM